MASFMTTNFVSDGAQLTALPEDELGRRDDSESEGTSMYNLGAGLSTGVVMCWENNNEH